LSERGLLGGKENGCGALWARPFYAGAPGRTRVVRLGSAEKIEAEYRNYREYVEPYIGGGRCTLVSELRRTPLLGGMIYSPLGTSDGRLETFSSFYERAVAEQINELLTRLFTETCGGWYSNCGTIKSVDLAEEYRRSLDLSPEALQALAQRFVRVDDLHGSASSGRAHSIGDILKTAAEMSLPAATCECVTHGRLTGDSVLVNDEWHAWLINFGSTGWGHLPRDLTCMDSFVRFHLLSERDATPDQRLLLEESLCAARFGPPASPGHPLASENPALRKAYDVALHLRGLAATLLPAAADGEREYYVSLFYHALDYARRPAPVAAQTRHALLSAELLAECLGL
jgi:hypothetical protein